MIHEKFFNNKMRIIQKFNKNRDNFRNTEQDGYVKNYKAVRHRYI